MKMIQLPIRKWSLNFERAIKAIRIPASPATSAPSLRTLDLVPKLLDQPLFC